MRLSITTAGRAARQTGIGVMGYGQRLRVQRSADVRVLKSQLDLIAAVVHSARFVGPAWALALACLASGRFGFFGHRPLMITVALPAAIAVVMLLGDVVIGAYRRDVGAHVRTER